MSGEKKMFPRFALSLSFLALLSSCGRVKGALPDGQYEIGDFTSYFYLNHDEVGNAKKELLEEKVITPDKYANGTNQTGFSSDSYCPLLYKIEGDPNPVSFEDDAHQYALQVDWAIFDDYAGENGYIWYRESYLPVIRLTLEKDDISVASSDYTVSATSADDSIAILTGGGSSYSLEVKGEGTTTLSVSVSIDGYELSSSATVTVEAPYASRIGLSDREDAADLFDVYFDKNTGEVSSTGQKISINPLYDWLPSDIYKTDQEFFSSKPSFGRYYSGVRAVEELGNGYLSKLYNGQLYCNGTHSKAFVCIDESGFTQIFPKKIKSADWFLMSFRGGSDDLSAGGTLYDGKPRISKFDLSLDFYYQNASGTYDYRTVTAEKVLTETDAGGEKTTLFGFRLSDVLSETSGIAGIGIRFTNFADRIHGNRVSASMPKTTDIQFGLLLYEIMFPNAVWE